MRVSMLRGLTIAAAVLATGWAGVGGGQPSRAETLSGETLLAFQVSEDLPIGRTFALMTAPAGAAGTLPSGLTPFSGLVEVCARGPEEGGRLLVQFEGDAGVILQRTGCDQLTIEQTTTVNLQSLRGAWDVVLRRLVTAAEAQPGNSYLVTKVPERSPFGKSLPLMTAPPSAVGEAPETAAPLTGTLEICAQGPAVGGRLAVLVNDDIAYETTESGCRQLTVSAAASATFIARLGPWDVIVRPAR